MKGTSTDKTNIQTNTAVAHSTKLLIELNQNRYVDFDQDWVDNNLSLYYGSADTLNYYKERFPISSVTKPIRPQKTGVCFARKVSTANTSLYPEYKFHGVKSFNNVLNSSTYSYDSNSKSYSPKPRIYYAGPAVQYQAYSQPQIQSGTRWSAFSAIIKYKQKFWSNKLVIGFDMTISPADYVQVFINTTSPSSTTWNQSGNWISAGTFAPNSDGQVVIYRTATSGTESNNWSSTKPSSGDNYWTINSNGYLSTPVYISGVKIVTGGNGFGPGTLIEVSPKILADISPYVTAWSWNANLSEQDSIHPVGTVSSNTGEVSIFNGNNFFLESNKSISQCSL